MKTTVYLATACGLSVITGSDSNWRGAVCLDDKQVQCVAFAQDQGTVYCGTYGDGLFQSTDRGATWKTCSAFPNSKVMALTASDSGWLYAGTEPSAILRSKDNGNTWHELQTLLTLPSAKTWSYPPRPKTHHVQSIFPDLAKQERLHVAIEAGALLHSDDMGATWHDRVPSSPRDTHSLAVHPQFPTRLHSAAGDGYFVSRDSGDSWQRFDVGLEDKYCWSIAVSNSSHATLVMSASKTAYAAHFKGVAASSVYRRTADDGWRQVKGGLPEPPGIRVPVVAASMNEPGVFYLSAEGEVYRSADEGLQWQKLAIHWDSKPPSEYAVNMAIFEEG